MYQEERIYEILKMLKNKKTLSIHEIISIFEISRDTIIDGYVYLKKYELYGV